MVFTSTWWLHSLQSGKKLYFQACHFRSCSHNLYLQCVHFILYLYIVKRMTDKKGEDKVDWMLCVFLAVLLICGFLILFVSFNTWNKDNKILFYLFILRIQYEWIVTCFVECKSSLFCSTMLTTLFIKAYYNLTNH